jgi:hyperosmotically inducible protein
MRVAIRILFLIVVFSGSILTLSATPAAAQTQEERNARTAAYLKREVGHVLRMLPYYTVFDDLKYSIDGDRVTLEGSVIRPTLKSDAEHAVKDVEGVESVTNNIKVLPPSNGDDAIRRAVYRSIFGTGPLFKYSFMAVPSIHIIVENGNITLEGVVDSEGDKNLAGLKAKSVPGTFNVTNNLVVVKS